MNVYEPQPLSHNQRGKIQGSVNSIGALIRRHFESLPESRISPSEFKELYKMPNPIHSLRPRFTELASDKVRFLQAMHNEKVSSPFGGEEARYILNNDSQLRIF